MIETDAAGRVVRLNAAAERLTGWTLEEKHGAPLDDVFRLAPQSAPGPEPAGGKLGTARPEYTALLERRDGQVIAIRHVMGTALPRMMVVTVENCQGARAYAGLVSSYHERVTQGYQRLTDQEWSNSLYSSPPADVPWLAPLLAP